MILPDSINTIVFDCDGVMFQTGELNRKYYNTLLEKLNLPEMDEDQFEFVKMHTADDSVKHLFDGRADKDLVEKERKKISYRDFVPFMEMTKDFMPLLKHLKNKNYKTAIATNRSNTMDLVMDTFELNEYFDMVVTAADVVNAKPDPEQLYKIKDGLKIKTDNMLYIGDSKLDQLAAHKAGIIFVAFGNSELKADLHVDEMGELMKVIR
jgi:HAD superfamily hydrolase (TIGR01549 family)